MATTVGTIQLIATIDTSQYKRGASEIESANDNIEKSANSTEKKSNSAFTGIAKVGLAAVAAAAVAAGAAIVSNLGGAIRRVDTLNNSARTFENMGFAADNVKDAMNALETSITGLPTPLDSAVRGMTSLAATYGDINKGQKIFSALNNAILGFGGTTAEVENALQQLSQLPMDGPLDAQTWNSLRNSGLTPVLVAMAEDMGTSVSQLKKDLGEGELTVQDFTDSLIKLNTQGGGGLKSLEQIAKDSTSGISTGWANMQTAITRGLASLIQAIGSENISKAISSIGSAFEGALKSLTGFIDFIKNNQTVVQNFAIVIGSLLLPLMLRLTASLIAAGVQATIMGARMAAAWLMALGPIGIIIAAVAGATALIVANWDTVRQFAIDTWQSIVNAASGAFNWIKANWVNILGILTLPIGGAAILIIKHFDKIKEAVGNVWGWAKGVFGTIGSVAATIIKAPVNAIIGFAQRTINGFINAINGAINTINKIPGVDISRVSTLNIPMLAEGGIVTSATLAMVGEGREPEAVIPLSKLDKMLDGEGGARVENNIGTINISDQQTADYFLKRLTNNQEITSQGLVPLQSYGV